MMNARVANVGGGGVQTAAAYKPFRQYRPDIVNEKKNLHDFISRFEDKNLNGGAHPKWGYQKYMIQLQRIADGPRTYEELEEKRQNARAWVALDLELEDLEDFFGKEVDRAFLEEIRSNTTHIQRLAEEVADALFPEASPINADAPNFAMEEEDPREVLNQQRRQQLALRNANAAPAGAGNNNGAQQLTTQERMHPLLTRKFELYFSRRAQLTTLLQARGAAVVGVKKGAAKLVLPFRQLNAELIGSLVTLKGVVVRVTQVQPLIRVACYSCLVCGSENTQTVTGTQYTPLSECGSVQCRTNRLKGKLVFTTGASVFQPSQTVLIQETSDQVPAGSVPRSFIVRCTGVNVRACAPGEQVLLTGVYLPSLPEDYQNRNKLVLDTYMEAHHIDRLKQSHAAVEIAPDRLADFLNFVEADARTRAEVSPQLYEALAKALAPELYGLLDVKKALLLQLVGGVTNVRSDGLRIRGDINIALVGDPGIAKSQLLKRMAEVSPRGVYTTGKGSSGVGLTASVVRDQTSGEVSLEGGALVLADTGVCCIDEFDKMNEFDRTAIHEVMEQQTVSIAKAGITTSLNARTAILAAANPLYGRYNAKLSPAQNINLPAALLSRFDLVFLLIDKYDAERDYELALHLSSVQETAKRAPPASPISVGSVPLDSAYVRDYISFVRNHITAVYVDQEMSKILIDYYVERRKEQPQHSTGADALQDSFPITVRSLLSTIRLAQAHARLRLSNRVEREDVDEAIRLTTVAFRLDGAAEDTENAANRGARIDRPAEILKIIKQKCSYNPQWHVKKTDIKQQLYSRGFQDQEIENAIRRYENLSVISVEENGQVLRYLQQQEK